MNTGNANGIERTGGRCARAGLICAAILAAGAAVAMGDGPLVKTQTIDLSAYVPAGWMLTQNAVVGDLDGSPGNELAVAAWKKDNTDCSVMVFRWQAGTLTHLYTATRSSSVLPGIVDFNPLVAAADTDTDGRLELIAGIQGGGTSATGQVGIFEYSGGTFSRVWTSPLASGITTRDVAAADLDGDGNNELVIGQCSYGRKLTVYERTGANAYTAAATVAPGGDCQFVSLGDPDRDGRNEIFCNFRYWSPNKYFVYRYQAGGIVEEASFRPSGASSIMGTGVIGDLRGDGNKQLVSVWSWYNNPQGVSVHQWNGAGYAEQWYSNALSAAGEAAVGDVLGNGRDQVVYGDTHAYVFGWDGGTYGVIQDIPGTFAACVGDALNDGRNDVLILNGDAEIDVYAVPEPAMTAVLLVSGLAAVRRRRATR
jgi:hypothetical protein